MSCIIYNNKNMPISKNRRIHIKKYMKFEKKKCLSHSEIKNNRKIKREIKKREGNLLFDAWSDDAINSLVELMEENYFNFENYDKIKIIYDLYNDLYRCDNKRYDKILLNEIENYIFDNYDFFKIYNEKLIKIIKYNINHLQFINDFC